MMLAEPSHRFPKWYVFVVKNMFAIVRLQISMLMFLWIYAISTDEIQRSSFVPVSMFYCITAMQYKRDTHSSRKRFYNWKNSAKKAWNAFLNSAYFVLVVFIIYTVIALPICLLYHPFVYTIWVFITVMIYLLTITLVFYGCVQKCQFSATYYIKRKSNESVKIEVAS